MERKKSKTSIIFSFSFYLFNSITIILTNWAIRSSNNKILYGNISSFTPFRLYFCDSSSTVKDACKESIAERNQEFEQLLEVMEEFPQMSLQLGYRNGSYDFVNLMADEGYDPVERCTEMAVQDPDFSEIINMRGKIKKR